MWIKKNIWRVKIIQYLLVSPKHKTAANISPRQNLTNGHRGESAQLMRSSLVPPVSALSNQCSCECTCTLKIPLRLPRVTYKLEKSETSSSLSRPWFSSYHFTEKKILFIFFLFLTEEKIKNNVRNLNVHVQPFMFKVDFICQFFTSCLTDVLHLQIICETFKMKQNDTKCLKLPNQI